MKDWMKDGLRILILGGLLLWFAGEWCSWRYSVSSYLETDSDERVSKQLTRNFGEQLKAIGVDYIVYDSDSLSEDAKAGVVEFTVKSRAKRVHFGLVEGVESFFIQRHPSEYWDGGLVRIAFFSFNDNAIAFRADIDYAKCGNRQSKIDCLYQAGETLLDEALKEARAEYESELKWDRMAMTREE